jgi:hypothetical protein
MPVRCEIGQMREPLADPPAPRPETLAAPHFRPLGDRGPMEAELSAAPASMHDSLPAELAGFATKVAATTAG